MDRVGGYAGYLALIEDARAYDDVLIAMEGAVDAQNVSALEAELQANVRGH